MISRSPHSVRSSFLFTYPHRPSFEPVRLTETSTLKTKKNRSLAKTFVKSLIAKPRDKYVLRLFVAGATARSLQAIRRVHQLCAAELKNNCTLEVIDILEQPELASTNQIVATPTLIKKFPRPVRRFIGNMANLDGLFAELG